MSFKSELKEFLMRGSVVDMAIGIVIGGAFGKIISSFVSDILMPPIAALKGDTSFSNMKVVLKQAAIDSAGVEVAPITWNYGNFIQTIVDFLIVGISIFMVIKAMNSAKRKKVEEPAAPPAPSQEERLLTEIRDLLKNK